jgi:phage recombination protein Bet
LALSYCRARNLDPFRRVVHIVPIWDKEHRCWVETVWPGIAEFRTTAFRTGEYAGKKPTEFGPTIKKSWAAGDGSVEVAFPEWAQVTVYRTVNGERVEWPGPRVYWLETFASVKSGAPNSMWQKRPCGQLEKCAEAAALRCAFPEEIGSEYTSDEAFLSGGRPAVNVEHTAPPQDLDALTDKLEGETVDLAAGNGPEATEPAEAATDAPADDPPTPEDPRPEYLDALAAATTLSGVDQVRRDWRGRWMSAEDMSWAKVKVEERKGQLRPKEEPDGEARE